MKKIALFVEEGLYLSTFSTVFDALKMAGVGWNNIVGQTPTPFFEIQVVSQSGGTIKTFGELELGATLPLNDLNNPDSIIILPSSQSLADCDSAVTEWFCRAYAAGSELASICVGAFRLARTGLLENRCATTHWAYTDQFVDLFPRVRLTTEKMVTEEEGLFCAGGMNAAADLTLHLITRHVSYEEAKRVSKVNLLDMDRPSQAVYGKHVSNIRHGDQQIIDIQEWLENNAEKPLSIIDLAEKANMSRRTFERRFKSATGSSPMVYLRGIRIDHAKKLLETSGKPIKEIAFLAGYEDESSFSQVFRKTVGIAPGQYRRKFCYDHVV